MAGPVHRQIEDIESGGYPWNLTQTGSPVNGIDIFTFPGHERIGLESDDRGDTFTPYRGSKRLSDTPMPYNDARKVLEILGYTPPTCKQIKQALNSSTETYPTTHGPQTVLKIPAEDWPSFIRECS